MRIMHRADFDWLRRSTPQKLKPLVRCRPGIAVHVRTQLRFRGILLEYPAPKLSSILQTLIATMEHNMAPLGKVPKPGLSDTLLHSNPSQTRLGRALRAMHCRYGAHLRTWRHAANIDQSQMQTLEKLTHCVIANAADKPSQWSPHFRSSSNIEHQHIRMRASTKALDCDQIRGRRDLILAPGSLNKPGVAQLGVHAVPLWDKARQCRQAAT